jgi:hypothetical protein
LRVVCFCLATCALGNKFLNNLTNFKDVRYCKSWAG